MTATRLRRSRWLPMAALCGIVSTIVFAPLSASADAHVTPGSLVTVTAAEPPLLRASPGYDAPALGELPPGSAVTVLDGPVAAPDGTSWFWVDAGGYLPDSALSSEPGADVAEPAAAPGAEPAGAPAAPDLAAIPPADPAPAAPVGTVQVVGTNGLGAPCQSAAEPSSAAIGWLAEASPVTVTGAQVGQWLPVDCSGAPGFVDAALVTWEATTAAPPPAGDPAAEGAPAAVDLPPPTPAAAPSPEALLAGMIAAAPEPEPTAPLLDPAPEPTPAAPASDRGRRGGGGGSGGSAIADFALQFEGSPYVYAGADPSTGFDCSGFTMYVVAQTLGLDISHDMFAQYAMGTPVDRSDLRPGDLVFFQNTFRPGMSHNGIYIGNGQMIHAENESTGVKISDINSDYYSSRWYGAVRFS